MNPKKINIMCHGYSIIADFYINNNAVATLLFLPGLRSTRKVYQHICPFFANGLSVNALVIDYSGHGESPFEFANTKPAHHFLEAMCALEWIKLHYSKHKIFVIGSSYGGFLAANLAKYKDFDKLFLRTPAIYSPNDYYSQWSEINTNETIIKYRKNSLELMQHPLFSSYKKFSGKCLVVTHQNDEVVPVQTTNAYIKFFKADTFNVKGFKHSYHDKSNSAVITAQYDKFSLDWLQKD